MDMEFTTLSATLRNGSTIGTRRIITASVPSEIRKDQPTVCIELCAATPGMATTNATWRLITGTSLNRKLAQSRSGSAALSKITTIWVKGAPTDLTKSPMHPKVEER